VLLFAGGAAQARSGCRSGEVVSSDPLAGCDVPNKFPAKPRFFLQSRGDQILIRYRLIIDYLRLNNFYQVCK
jgi:hypothetical protein